jgi:hypothetical protein
VSICHFCSGVITTSYYRVARVMACPACVEKERANELANRGRFFRRGLFFAIPAALAGSLMMWGVDEFSTISGSSLYSPGAFLRGLAIMVLGIMVAAAAMSGAKKRGSRMLQLSAVTLTYLAYSMALGLYALNRVPSGRMTFSSAGTILLMAPAFPFLAIMTSWLAITGLLVLSMAIWTVWKSTAPVVPVSGPFDPTDSYAEKPLFKGI